MTDEISFRTARVTDGAPVYALIEEIGGLERNTCYAYLLLCSHFADSCVIAEEGGRMLGFVLGYTPPNRRDAMFVWQVGVHPDARGRGLATRLLDQFVALPAFAECTHLEATVATDNEPSRALFRGFARKRGAACEEGPMFTPELFPPGIPHPAEELFRIGPLGR